MATPYQRGVEFVAENDEPTVLDHSFVTEMISVQCLAWAFGKTDGQVATDVIGYRVSRGAVAPAD